MVTHKEGLMAASEASYGVTSYGGADVEAAIRAYIDARGLVMVPREPTAEMVTAGGNSQSVNARGNRRTTYRAMLDHAPDPFKDDAP
jgi:hypothetical protein